MLLLESAALVILSVEAVLGLVHCGYRRGFLTSFALGHVAVAMSFRLYGVRPVANEIELVILVVISE